MAESSKTIFQFLEVVYFAVENNPVAVAIGHRLVAGGRKVDDRQTAVCQTQTAVWGQKTA